MRAAFGLRVVVAAALAVALCGADAPAAAADAPSPPTYRQAVEATYGLIRDASVGDVVTARQAISLLEAGTGQTQPEILGDLSRQPPDFEDAKARLLSLLAALDAPAGTADPALAQQRLHQVLAMPRYDALHRPPSWLDRFLQWVGDRITQLLGLLFGRRGGPQAPAWLLYLVGAAVLLSVGVIAFRSTGGRFAQEALASQRGGPRAPSDYFAEADRQAAKGDRVAAIRALCAGVAATLAGERSWDGSPLTVREIFLGAPDPSALRPLLLPFEAAIYGGRGVDAETYERAARVAAPYRKPARVAA